MTAPREMTDAEIVFHASPCEPVEDRSRVHAWLIDLDDVALWRTPDGSFPALEFYLSTEEQARAGRIRDPRTRGIWRQSRTILRHILGLCVNVPPQDIRFAEGAQGKPTILYPAFDENSMRRLDFNLSHSDNALLIGVSFDANIGVDIEVIDRDLDVMALAEAHFSVAERNQLAALPPRERQIAFYRCWALKEAALKAHGLGVSAGLGAIDLSIDSTGTPRVVKPATGADACYQRVLSIGENAAAMALFVGYASA